MLFYEIFSIKLQEIKNYMTYLLFYYNGYFFSISKSSPIFIAPFHPCRISRHSVYEVYSPYRKLFSPDCFAYLIDQLAFTVIICIFSPMHILHDRRIRPSLPQLVDHT